MSRRTSPSGISEPDPSSLRASGRSGAVVIESSVRNDFLKSRGETICVGARRRMNSQRVGRGHFLPGTVNDTGHDTQTNRFVASQYLQPLPDSERRTEREIMIQGSSCVDIDEHFQSLVANPDQASDSHSPDAPPRIQEAAAAVT